MSHSVWKRTPFQCTLLTVHPVTQWNVVVWATAGSARTSDHSSVIGFLTWPPISSL